MIFRLAPALLLVPALALVEHAVRAPEAAARSMAVAAPVPAELATWRIDVSHSELTFTIRHFVSRVRGKFGKWEGTIVADADAWQGGSVDVKIETASIDTDNERRDTHLRTSDFFLADSFPQITFKSTKVERKGAEAKVYGNLTMRGVTKPVVLEGRFIGLQKAANGADRIGFEARTTVNRLDYGVKWNRAAEGGGAMLGDDVTIEMVIAAVRQKP